MLEEYKNQMKLCTLCFNNGEYSDTDVEMHRLLGLHKTDGTTWSPTKGHARFEEHEWHRKHFGLMTT